MITHSQLIELSLGRFKIRGIITCFRESPWSFPSTYSIADMGTPIISRATLNDHNDPWLTSLNIVSTEIEEI
jgi:hypothetical protein